MGGKHQLRSLVLGCLGACLLAPRAVALSGTYSLSNTVPNLCIPTDDTFDWGACYDYDFQVLVASFSTLGIVPTAVGASTASLQTQLTAEALRAITAETAIGVSTASILSLLNSTASALTTETSRATVRENAIAASTGTIYAALNSTASALTTVTAALAGKANTFVGITSGCAAGYYLSTMTVTNGVVTGGGCVLAGTGSASLIVATGPLSGVGSTRLPSETTFYFDSVYFIVSDSANIKSSVISLASGTAGTGWTRQVFTSGSAATYTTPAGVIQIRVRMVGGGGGGGGVATNTQTAGTGGNESIFNSVHAAGGGGGGVNIAWNGGLGGTGGSGSASFRSPGGPGASGMQLAANFSGTGAGGSSLLGAGAVGPSFFEVDSAAGHNGISAAANTGGGGSAADDSTGNGYLSGSGGGGEYVELVITNPAGSYTYTVGAAANGGASTYNGGNGGSGIIIVDEMQPSIAPQGIQGVPGTAATIAAGTAVSVSSLTAPTVTNSGTSSAAIFNFNVPQGNDGIQGIQGNTGSVGPSGNGGAGWTATTPAGLVYLTTSTNGVLMSSATFTSTVTIQGNAFSVGGSTLVVAGGFVGVGATPLYPFSIVANGYADGYNVFIGTSNTGSAIAMRTPVLTAGTSPSIYGLMGGANPGPLSINPSGGNVGIGTASPAFKLDTNSLEYITTSGTGVQQPTCSAGKQVLAGGCFASGGATGISESYPYLKITWVCYAIGGVSVQAFAICAGFN